MVAVVDEDGSRLSGGEMPLGRPSVMHWLYYGVSAAGGGAFSGGVFFSLGDMAPAWLGVAGVGICVVGVVGDLWESLLKRLATVKVRRESW